MAESKLNSITVVLAAAIISSLATIAAPIVANYISNKGQAASKPDAIIATLNSVPTHLDSISSAKNGDAPPLPVLTQPQNNPQNTPRNASQNNARSQPLEPLLVQSHTLHINKLTSSTIMVLPEDHVKMRATGSISVGQFIGAVGPDGKSSNLGFSLEGYNIVRKFPHGALLWRVKGNPWELCGSKSDVIISTGGELEFEINDNDQSDNSPNDSFDLEIEISRKH